MPSDYQHFRTMWKAGIRANAIARAFGVSRKTVYYWRQKLNLKPRDGARRVKLARLRVLYERGTPVSEIMKEFGVTARSTIKAACKRAGIKQRPCGAPKKNKPQ